MGGDADEQRLIERLRLIEALHAGAGTPGERDAAAAARERILERLRKLQQTEKPVEYTFRMPDQWSRMLFVALLRRYEIRPYRYPRQRHSTVMARVPASFVNETLWPQYTELSRTLRTFLSQTTDRVIREGIQSDASEAEVRQEPARLEPEVQMDGPGDS